jgi:hypothetical protein
MTRAPRRSGERRLGDRTRRCACRARRLNLRRCTPRRARRRGQWWAGRRRRGCRRARRSRGARSPRRGLVPGSSGRRHPSDRRRRSSRGCRRGRRGTSARGRSRSGGCAIGRLDRGVLELGTSGRGRSTEGRRGGGCLCRRSGRALPGNRLGSAPGGARHRRCFGGARGGGGGARGGGDGRRRSRGRSGCGGRCRRSGLGRRHARRSGRRAGGGYGLSGGHLGCGRAGNGRGTASVDRLGAGYRADRLGDRRLLHSGGGRRGDFLLCLGGALGSATGPIAQASDLARLREDQQRQHGDPHQGGEGDDRPDLREFA